MTHDEVTRTADGTVITVGMRVYWFSKSAKRFRIGTVYRVSSNRYIVIQGENRREYSLRCNSLYGSRVQVLQALHKALDDVIARTRNSLAKYRDIKSDLVSRFGDEGI